MLIWFRNIFLRLLHHSILVNFMKYLTIVVDDRVGLIADISYILSKAKINIESISVEVVGDKAIISLGIKDLEKAQEVFRNSGYVFTKQNALVLKLLDRPGELNNIAFVLKEKNIKINNVHILSRGETQTIISIVVDKPKTAKKLLEKYLVI